MLTMFTLACWYASICYLACGAEGISQVFGHKPTQLSRGEHECVEFCGSPSNGCPYISLKTTNVNLMVALEKKSGDHQSQ